MMQGHFAALSFKYDIYHVLSFTNIYHLLLNSQRQMLCYYITHILRDAGLFLVEGAGVGKTTFHLTFFEPRYLS